MSEKSDEKVPFGLEGAEPIVHNEEEGPIEIEAPAEDEPISLVEEVTTIGAEVRAIGSAATAGEKRTAHFKRPLNPDPHGARRCRLFHSRIAQAPLAFMENQINDWIDGEAIDVKQVGHLIGVMEGKTSEANLIVIVWY